MKAEAFIPVIENTLTELGPVSNLGAIQQGIRVIRNQPNWLHADIYLSMAVCSNAVHGFWTNDSLKEKKAGAYGDYYFRFFYEQDIPLRQLGAAFAAIGIVVLDENLSLEQVLLHHLGKNVFGYSMLFILNYTGLAPAIPETKNNFYGKCITVDMAARTENKLEEILEENISAELKEKLRERCFINTLNPLLQLTKETIQQEQYITGVRKNINTQLGTLLRKDELEANINDMLNAVKTQLQYWNSDTEKMIKIKYEELNKPSTGRYSQSLLQWGDALKDLERRKVAEKAERLITVISEPFLTFFEGKLRQELSADFTDDYSSIAAAANATVEKLNLLLEQKGIAVKDSRPLAIDYSRFPTPEKTLRNYVGFTRMYSGELTKKGATEYFAALREHTGSIMVAVGLLAPLNMVASAASGESHGDQDSFLGKVSIVLRHARNAISFTTAIIIIVMIIWGYFDLRKRIPRKRVEEFERELRKARENLTVEGKRMFSDASRDWQSGLNVWLREAYTQLQGQLEKAAREHAAGLQQKLNDEKMRIQRLNQGLDNSTRRISVAERAVEDLARNYKDSMTDLEKAFR